MRLQRAIQRVSQQLEAQPEAERARLVNEAALAHELSPVQEEFLYHMYGRPPSALAHRGDEPRLRIDPAKVARSGYEALRVLEAYVRQSGLEARLLALVKLRASQINGCAYCVDRHTKDARAAGETEQRLHLLAAWREVPGYTERERAALAWTEAVACGAGHVPDEIYRDVRERFDQKELVDLALAVVALNAWNRLASALQTSPGRRQSRSSVAN